MRAMGIKERCTAADVIRRAILSRAGLEKVPDDNMLAKLDKAETPSEAAEALVDCQTVEYIKREFKQLGRTDQQETMPVVMLSSKWYRDESLSALQTLQNGIQEQNITKKPRPIELTRREFDVLCRLIANTIVSDEKTR